MDFKHFINSVLATAFVVCLCVGCSDDDEPNYSPDDTGETEQPLSVPGNVAYTATPTSFHFTWASVSGANSYEASIAKESTPNDKGTLETSRLYCDFSNLEPNTSYIFTLRALSTNSELNSDYVEVTATTTDYEKLDAPTNLEVYDVTASEATIAWAAVSGAEAYRVKIETEEGDEIETVIVTATKYTVKYLAEGFYVAYVQSVYGDGTTLDEYSSDWASISFEATSKPHLTAPSVKLITKTHGMAIVEWELSTSMLVEQPLFSNPHTSDEDWSDRYNFRLCDASGNVLRQIDTFDDFFFRDYPYYRIAWGGLDANTTYSLEMQRVPTDEREDTYTTSDWAKVEVTTDPEPDKSGYLLYWDFDNVPFNANAMYIAYGFKRETTEDDWLNPNNLTYSANYTDNSIDCQGVTTSLGQSFFDAYLPGMNIAEYLNPSKSASYSTNSTHNISVQVGHMRFGGGAEASSWITLPALDVPSGSTIYLEIDACPYCACGTGDIWNSWNGNEGATFYVQAPGAKIESIESGFNKTGSISTDGETATLNNVSVKNEMNASDHGDGDPFYYTDHKVKISGVGPETRILIYTSLTARQYMWADNIKISLAN